MNETWLLVGTAASLGVVHTLLGPDHYLPFIALARVGAWSRAKAVTVTLLCGLGHLLTSLVLGLVGIALGVSLTRLEAIESVRGRTAAWLLIGFGLAYAGWGLWRALSRRPHTHVHVHVTRDDRGEQQALLHTHLHTHSGAHAHPHGNPARMTPWVLFTIFVFGPCEPLIPLLLYPAARASWMGVGLVAVVFGATTLLTMTGVVLLALAGIQRVPFGVLERYVHVLAGATIAACGVAIQFLGL